jgi:hypothetical protein
MDFFLVTSEVLVSSSIENSHLYDRAFGAWEALFHEFHYGFSFSRLGRERLHLTS